MVNTDLMISLMVRLLLLCVNDIMKESNLGG